MDKKDVKLQFRFERINGKTKLIFEIPPEIEEIYKNLAEEIRESKCWKGLRFYYIPKLLNNQSYQGLLNDYGFYDDYGSEIMRGNKFNIAWLRTVGGKGEIVIDDVLPWAFYTQTLKLLVNFIKVYFAEFHSNSVIKGEITIEV